jgi:hypothetical protein
LLGKYLNEVLREVNALEGLHAFKIWKDLKFVRGEVEDLHVI